MPTIQVNSEQWVRFRDAIAQIESGNNYYRINSRGFLGRYQFGERLLTDVGYYCGDRSPAPSRAFPNNDFDGRWTGRGGANDFLRFMFNGNAQDDAFNRAMQLYYNQLNIPDVTQHLNQLRGNVLISWGGLLAASWECGTGAVIAFVRSNGAQPGSSAVRAAIGRRLGNFGGYAIPVSPSDPPDLGNDFSRCREVPPPPNPDLLLGPWGGAAGAGSSE